MESYPEGPPARRGGVSPQIAIVAVIVVVLGLVLAAVDFATDLAWFDSVGFTSVFFVSIYGRLGLLVAGAILFAAIYLANVLVARRLAYGLSARPRRAAGARTWEDLLAQLGSEMAQRVDYARYVNPVVILVGLLLSIFMGLNAAGSWMTVALFGAQQPFGVSDPAFGLDVGFFVFAMPALRALEAWLFLSWVLISLSIVAVYAVVLTYELAINIGQLGFPLTSGIKRHILCIAAVGLLLLGFHHLLDMFDLVRSTRGFAYGAGYTDYHLQRPAQVLMAGAAVLAALLCLANMWAARLRMALAGVVLWVAAVLGGWIVPGVIQNLDVIPNELDRERPWIEANLKLTRAAFGLDRIEERDIAFEEAVQPNVVTTDRDTLNNVRLWDARPLKDTYRQIQAIRQYYFFEDVDVDRYTIDNEYVQVMASARELVPDLLPAQTQSWISRRLQYTHGYGVAMSRVNSVSQEGLPEFAIRDVPPVGRLPITRPEIYFGEKTDHYVIVGTTYDEFDYPSGDQGAYGRYSGGGGIPVGTLLQRLLFAVRLQDASFLLNTGLGAESRLFYRRNVAERARFIAPFLRMDRDPYIVVADGGLFWIQDAYTVSDQYPYAQPYTTEATPRGVRRRAVNYIRNSVKIVTSAYDGSMRFYVSDPNDPLINSYRTVFPDLFIPQDQATRDIRAHFRYPEDLFRIQSELYKQYHVRDARVFYLKEDMWTIPKELFYAQQQPVDPYYIIMKLPGETRPEFLLMLPFTPGNKDNMVGWLAARCDDANYGKMVVYKYPKDKVIFGPFQLETRIDQDPLISQQFTLWNQAGSQVIRGNMLVIPMGDSILYVEPIYLQATASPLPELKRVIVATGSRIVMEPTLKEGLDRLLGAAPALASTPPGPSGPVPSVAPGTSQTATELAVEAREHFLRAQEALKAGDFARYGDELRLVEDSLNRLVEVTGPR